MGKRSRIMAAFLAVLMMAAFMPAVTRDVYAGMYDVDFTIKTGRKPLSSIGSGMNRPCRAVKFRHTSSIPEEFRQAESLEKTETS